MDWAFGAFWAAYGAWMLVDVIRDKTLPRPRWQLLPAIVGLPAALVAAGLGVLQPVVAGGFAVFSAAHIGELVIAERRARTHASA